MRFPDEEAANFKRTIERLYDEKDALRQRAEKAEARIEKLQSVGAEAIKLLRILAEFYDTTDKLIDNLDKCSCPPVKMHLPDCSVYGSVNINDDPGPIGTVPLIKKQ